MTPTAISMTVLWVLQVCTAVVLLGVARQVGVLHLRLPPRGPGMLDESVPAGVSVHTRNVESLRSEVTAIFAPDHLTLVTFANPSCALCGPVLEGLRKLPAVYRDVNFLVAVDGERSTAVEYLDRYGFADGVPSESLAEVGASPRPFAIVVSPDGRVLASGVPNTLEQAEILIERGRRGMLPSEGANNNGETSGVLGSEPFAADPA